MPQKIVAQETDSFTGPVLTGTPAGGVRADRVRAAGVVAEALLVAEQDQVAAFDAMLDEAFGPYGATS